MVRYGTGCPNTGYQAENEGEPVPNAPYATFRCDCFLLPAPCSLLPAPCSLFPVPCSLCDI
ncbi:hypothetical protein [Moorena sp. SIOASIH]|uniref:hypothetical protein n=1 Tax=Moorena sp. SIOASIH TaxID=2607817 RepID=UPI0025D7A119|nr:hypothetical protein [Moorena sp. SIOASIH]